VLLEPAAFDRQIEPCAVLRWRGLQIEQKWPAEQFDADAAVLNGFNRVGEFDQLAGCHFRVSVGAVGGAAPKIFSYPQLGRPITPSFE
jgi:hypothetical protein